jgi:hypothetical protein
MLQVSLVNLRLRQLGYPGSFFIQAKRVEVTRKIVRREEYTEDY